MSSKRTPREGKSGYWRKEAFRRSFALASSEVGRGSWGESLAGACWVASGAVGGGWEEVESRLGIVRGRKKEEGGGRGWVDLIEWVEGSQGLWSGE